MAGNSNTLTLKQRKWLNSYLICFNKAQAARDAEYKCKDDNCYARIGSENYIKLYPHIEKWLAEEGLSDDRIKAKIAKGLEAKETKFFAFQGQIIDQVEVEALGIQVKYTDMAAKVKGLYDDDKIDPTGAPINLTITFQRQESNDPV